MADLNWDLVDRLIELAFCEDFGEKGDVTSEALNLSEKKGKAEIFANEEGVLAGLPVIKRVYEKLGEVTLEIRKEEGDRFGKGEAIAVLKGNLEKILMGERISLNFLSRLSGIATLTSKFVEKVEGCKVKILDTRKTTPGLRELEKYAVRVGGGENHRFGLFDGVLIKDNHLKAFPSPAEAVRKAKEKLKKEVIEVEVENLDELREALKAGADIILLDNMDVETLREAVKIASGEAKLESSGGIDLSNIEEVAKTGVDFISIGALTHSAKPIDFSLEVVEVKF
jgi:nicotinate-nucleotide pyrophosphorylase (carboxylating)